MNGLKIVAVGMRLMAKQVANAQSIIEESVVTAQKWEQTLQDVPLSITALNWQANECAGCAPKH